MDFIIDRMNPDDWEQVHSIYVEGISTGHATFETEVPSWNEWNAGHHRWSMLVARRGRDVIGWAVLGPTSNRAVYAGVAEVTVYVGTQHRNRGVGRALLRELIALSEQNGMWTLQAVIFPENRSSLALHRSTGFREVGRRERIGKMGCSWRDTMLLERRSPIVGSDRDTGGIMNLRGSILGLVGWIALSFAAALVGSRFTPSEWYAQLIKPSWTPPNAVFAPVWTVLYAMMGVAAWLVWRSGSLKAVALPLVIFSVQLALNALWSYIFFGLQRPGLAFADIVILWVAIIVTLIVFSRHSTLAGALFVPYLVWVSFAAFLNYSVWRLNP